MLRFVRTMFKGWKRQPTLPIETRIAIARDKASEVQQLLESERVIEAYQTTLDTLVDQILNTPPGPQQAEVVMSLLAQAQGLVAVFRHLGRHANEAEVLEATQAKGKRDSTIFRRRAA
jgi:hypothetical protein